MSFPLNLIDRNATKKDELNQSDIYNFLSNLFYLSLLNCHEALLMKGFTLGLTHIRITTI